MEKWIIIVTLLKFSQIFQLNIEIIQMIKIYHGFLDLIKKKINLKIL